MKRFEDIFFKRKEPPFILHKKKSENIPDEKSKKNQVVRLVHVLVVLVKAHLPSPDLGADSSADIASPESLYTAAVKTFWQNKIN